MLAYKLYQLLSIHDYEEIEKLIKKLDLENLLLNTNISLDNGSLSNLLLYYIKFNNNIIINHIYNNYDLMKRDYLKLIKYYIKCKIPLFIIIF